MAFSLIIKIGGEGVISAGDFLTEAAVRSGYHVVNFKSFPAEIKGGYANSTVRYQMRNSIARVMDLIFYAVLTLKLTLTKKASETWYRACLRFFRF
jgi:Pyruvate:ferredoxin oxidoreductase and related 2-oxoacid:ferredoxin oxidoreductases, gamma subunit